MYIQDYKLFNSFTMFVSRSDDTGSLLLLY